MGPDLRIDWDDACANPNDFERLVKLLLQRLYPDGEVVDGSGGDGGREFQVRTTDLLTLFEAKSFTGRVSARNPDRRSQVEHSLVSAVRHQPDTWNLVVPIDPTPAELAWFDALKSTFSFIDHWHGRTWLEEQLARHPDLVRYAIENTLLEYVRQYKIETEALAGGVPDLLERHQALVDLGDTISPHWRPAIGHLPDGTQVVTMLAKHSTAAQDAPIRFHFTVEIPDAPDTRALREQLRSSMEFGTSVEIPGRYLSSFTSTGPDSDCPGRTRSWTGSRSSNYPTPPTCRRLGWPRTNPAPRSPLHH